MEHDAPRQIEGRSERFGAKAACDILRQRRGRRGVEDLDVTAHPRGDGQTVFEQNTIVQGTWIRRPWGLRIPVRSSGSTAEMTTRSSGGIAPKGAQQA
ncbi:MAG: hypothetical protein R3C68_13895 [Myxococcota bacterium]